MKNVWIDSLEQWRRLELEPIEEITKVVNRLAPPQPRTLAQRYDDETFNEITERIAERITTEVPGNPAA